MNKLLIIVIETKSKEKNSDGIYIRTTLDYYYEYKKTTNIKYVFLDGKGNYNKKDVVRQINNYIKDAKKVDKSVEYNIVYVLDKDNEVVSYDDVKLNEHIQEYCERNRYGLIWMNMNIEDVYLGHFVEKKAKVKEAIEFSRRNKIETVDKRLLSNKSIPRHTSNILCVLDNYLLRKE